MARKKTKTQPKMLKKTKQKKSKLSSISPPKELDLCNTRTTCEYKIDVDSLSLKIKSKSKTFGQYLKNKLQACNNPTSRKIALFVVGVCCGVVVDHLFIKCG